MQLYPHQQKFLDKNPNKALLVWEAGCGKTFAGALWLKNRDSKALVVCPKQIVANWKEQAPRATVVSKDEFKKLDIEKHYTALIVDEADEFASPAFTKQRSKRTEKMYFFIMNNPDMDILLLTATPIRSNPWNLHTLLCFIGQYKEKKKWQEYFFTLQYRPFLPRPAFFPVPNWRTKIRPVLEKYSDIALMRDCVDYLPPITEETIKVKSEPYNSEEVEQMAQFVDEHRHEQLLKGKQILEAGRQYRKVFVVAHYREQIDQLEKELKKHKQVYILDGRTKKPDEVIKQAQEDDECYFIVQASVGAGFDADTFSCMVFASMSYKVRDFIQMKARIRRIHALHPVIYYYLIGGVKDKKIFDTVMLGRDFIPSEYMQK